MALGLPGDLGNHDRHVVVSAPSYGHFDQVVGDGGHIVTGIYCVTDLGLRHLIDQSVTTPQRRYCAVGR